jgi:hypothetical protein
MASRVPMGKEQYPCGHRRGPRYLVLWRARRGLQSRRAPSTCSASPRKVKSPIRSTSERRHGGSARGPSFARALAFRRLPRSFVHRQNHLHQRRVQAPAGLKPLLGDTLPLARRVIAFTSDERNRNRRSALPTTDTARCPRRKKPQSTLAHPAC